MKAIQIKEAGKLDVVDVEMPEVSADEVLLKINYRLPLFLASF